MNLLITFSNSLDANQDRLNVDPDLDPNRRQSDSVQLPERFSF